MEGMFIQRPKWVWVYTHPDICNAKSPSGFLPGFSVSWHGPCIVWIWMSEDVCLGFALLKCPQLPGISGFAQHPGAPGGSLASLSHGLDQRLRRAPTVPVQATPPRMLSVEWKPSRAAASGTNVSAAQATQERVLLSFPDSSSSLAPLPVFSPALVLFESSGPHCCSASTLLLTEGWIPLEVSVSPTPVW